MPRERRGSETVFALRNKSGRGWQLFIGQVAAADAERFACECGVPAGSIRIVSNDMRSSAIRPKQAIRPVTRQDRFVAVGWGDWIFDPLEQTWLSPEDKLRLPHYPRSHDSDVSLRLVQDEFGDWSRVRLGNGDSGFELLLGDLLLDERAVLGVLEAAAQGKYCRTPIGGPAHKLQSIEVHPWTEESIRLVGREIEASQVCHPLALDILADRRTLVTRLCRDLRALLKTLKDLDPEEYRETLSECATHPNFNSRYLNSWV